MKTIVSIKDMTAEAARLRRSARAIALVPTMGALHEGHLSLIRKARKAADVVVVSIFVNPIQFGPSEDFESYPRELERDSAACREEEVTILFAPLASEMYPSTHSTFVEESDLSRALCGRTRPGHFRGVTTVVAKLLNIVLPDVVLFGQKDAQQARVVEQMVANLNCPVEVSITPTVREGDGLAMSSRNRCLSQGEREQAPSIHRALAGIRDRHCGGTDDVASLLDEARSTIQAEIPSCQIEYLEIVDYTTLQPVLSIEGRVLVAAAVQLGRTRLIDNMIIGE